jgi:hypothetical protein
MILAYKKYPVCSENKCQDIARSDESKLEEDMAGEVCGVDHGASIMIQVEM